MKKGCAVVMLLLLCPAFLYAGDTLSVMQRNLRNNSFGETFFDLLYRNPAEKYYQHALTLTEVNAIVEYSDEDQPIFLQKGDGLICGSFDVDSYISLKNRKLCKRSCLGLYSDSFFFYLTYQLPCRAISLSFLFP